MTAAGCRGARLAEEALWIERVWVGKVVWVVVDGVDAHGHVVAFWDVLAVDIRSTCADFSPQCSWCWRCESHCFFQACAEVMAGVEEDALTDGSSTGEDCAKLLC